MSDFQTRLQHALAGAFRIERELGGAGMSRVFVATETALERRVVVKVLPPELAAGVNVERFRREIQLAAQLQHPHIVPLLAAGDDDQLLWFSMPYIEGESLRGALTRHGRLPPRDVVRILHDVVDALAYAHARGVVHRDIKPDNILTSGMHALVTDFGVAKALSAAIPVHGGTTTGMAIGTPAYMAPEQLAADPAADHRVDLYAVGLLAYELLTGSSPFTGASPQATLAAQLTQVPEPPHRTLRDIPEPLSALIMHCLEKDADRRPQSALALLGQLEALPLMSATTSGAASVLGSRPGGRQPRAAVLAGALALVAMAAWALIPRGGGPPGEQVGLDARDAGPGGDVRSRLAPRRANGAASVAGDSAAALAANDSVAGYQAITDAASGTVVPFVITRAESLAIAEAVSRRVGTQRAEVDRAELVAEVGRIFADSMSRAIKEMETAMQRAPQFVRPPELSPAPGTATRVEARRDGFDARTAPKATAFMTPLLAPPSDDRIRVVVTTFTNATGRREIGVIARDAATQLRSAVPADRFDVVSADVTERATRSLPDKMSVGWALRADFVVSGWVIARGDSLSMVTMLTDVRTGRFQRATESVTAPDVASTKPALENARKQMGAWLDTAATLAARRRAADTVRR
ncbi:serine/threonine-protein kinase [Gemmatimonas sp.]|uniref:serine/threonine-protein kinase n=1 Tax=Gemmatimonas sp. TaxID=1962908 RepID=UPI0037BF9507